LFVQASEENHTLNWNIVRLAYRQGTFVPLFASALAGAAIITPVIVVLVRSFTSGKLGASVGFTGLNYLRVFGDKQIVEMLSNSIIYAAGASALGTGLGALLAWIVARTNTPGKTLVELMPLYPILMPPIMKNIAWILLLAPRSGILNGVLEQFFGVKELFFNAFYHSIRRWRKALTSPAASR
jgi:iron(III) transport system permease protein